MSKRGKNKKMVHKVIAELSMMFTELHICHTNPTAFSYFLLTLIVVSDSYSRECLLLKTLSFHVFSSEKGDLRIKTEALKRVIQQILNGEKMPSLLMVIIKFLMPLDDHTIKKLLLIFWEIVPKTGQDGKLLQEMILVCDAYRKVRVLIMKRRCNLVMYMHVCTLYVVCLKRLLLHVKCVSSEK